MGACPDRETLLRMLAGDLPAADEAPVVAHVDGCVPCQQVLEELTADARPPALAGPADRTSLFSGLEAGTSSLRLRAGGSVATLVGRAGDAQPPDGAPTADPLDVPGYELLGILGRGGMGVVYKATDENLRRTVALKVLPPEHVGDGERRARFLREARSAAAVTHANIATVHDAGEDAGRIIMRATMAPSLWRRAL